MYKNMDMEELFAESTAPEYGCDNEITNDISVLPENDDGFDYTGWRLHRYDDYKGPLTVEIAVVKYEALVRKYAAKYASKGAEYDDLVQSGFEAVVRWLPGHENDEGAEKYLKKLIRGKILETAELLRNQADFENRTFFDEFAVTVSEDAGGDWLSRETVMFEKVRALLSAEEMREVELLYAGHSKRGIAEVMGVSHTAVNKRFAVIRRKLFALKPWLEVMALFKCEQD